MILNLSISDQGVSMSVASPSESFPVSSASMASWLPFMRALSDSPLDQVWKSGNSWAVRLPAAVVDALGLRARDEIEISIAGPRDFKVGRERGLRKTLDFAHRIQRFP